MIRAVIFDCFGVLVSDGLHALAAELYPDDHEALSEVWGLVNKANRGLMSSDELSAQIASLFGLTLANYHERLDRGEVKDHKLLSYIAGLRGVYKTAMLSNIPKDSLFKRFEEAELKRHFDVVVVSGDIGYAKPEAEAYGIVADRLGVRCDECIFTDDRQPYLEGAQALGMYTILYKNFAQFRADFEKLIANS